MDGKKIFLLALAFAPFAFADSALPYYPGWLATGAFLVAIVTYPLGVIFTLLGHALAQKQAPKEAKYAKRYAPALHWNGILLLIIGTLPIAMLTLWTFASIGLHAARDAVAGTAGLPVTVSFSVACFVFAILVAGYEKVACHPWVSAHYAGETESVRRTTRAVSASLFLLGALGLLAALLQSMGVL